MKIISKFLMLLLITGCSTKSTLDAPASFSSASDKGLAIGTITFEGEGPKNDIYRFFYYPVTGDKKAIKNNKGKIQLLGRVNKERAYSGDFNNSRTYLFTIEREPGQYAFTEYNYLTHIGYTGMVNNSNKFSIPFEVKKGEISYIGEFTYMENAEKGTPRIIVSDRMGRDTAEFKKKFPNINWDSSVNRTPKSGETGGGIVDFR